MESKGKLMYIWNIENAIIDDTNITDTLATKWIAFKKEDKLLLPETWSFESSQSFIYSRWEHTRRDFINGQVTIDDMNQGLFDGTYEIDIIDHQKPQLIKLSSDRINLYLRGILGFTDGQTTLPIDWLEGTERDPRHPKNRETKTDSTSMKDIE